MKLLLNEMRTKPEYRGILSETLQRRDEEMQALIAQPDVQTIALALIGNPKRFPRVSFGICRRDSNTRYRMQWKVWVRCVDVTRRRPREKSAGWQKKNKTTAAIQKQRREAREGHKDVFIIFSLTAPFPMRTRFALR